MENYCYFIISCKKNINIVNLCIDQLLNNTSRGNIYVSFDEKCNFKYDDRRIIVLDDSSEKKSCFGSRIQNAIKRIEEEYIVVMCDDFIVETQVDESSLSLLKDYMILNKKISSIVLAKTSSKKVTSDQIIEHYYRCKNYTNFRITLQCSMWNKNAFITLMKDVKSPWEFEIFSNYKTFCAINLFYALDDDKNQPIKYNRGTFAIRGKIVEPERQRLERILRKEIVIDGFEITDSYEQPSNLTFLGKIKRRFKMSMYNLKYHLKSIKGKVDLNLRIDE